MARTRCRDGKVEELIRCLMMRAAVRRSHTHIGIYTVAILRKLRIITQRREGRASNPCSCQNEFRLHLPGLAGTVYSLRRALTKSDKRLTFEEFCRSCGLARISAVGLTTSRWASESEAPSTAFDAIPQSVCHRYRKKNNVENELLLKKYICTNMFKTTIFH